MPAGQVGELSLDSETGKSFGIVEFGDAEYLVRMSEFRVLAAGDLGMLTDVYKIKGKNNGRYELALERTSLTKSRLKQHLEKLCSEAKKN